MSGRRRWRWRIDKESWKSSKSVCNKEVDIVGGDKRVKKSNKILFIVLKVSITNLVIFSLMRGFEVGDEVLRLLRLLQVVCKDCKKRLDKKDDNNVTEERRFDKIIVVTYKRDVLIEFFFILVTSRCKLYSKRWWF